MAFFRRSGVDIKVESLFDISEHASLWETVEHSKPTSVFLFGRPPYATYKTASPAVLGQYCYPRMGQGLAGASAEYSRLKDLALRTIPVHERCARNAQFPLVRFGVRRSDKRSRVWLGKSQIRIPGVA